jgi:arsenate reductase
MSAKRITFYGYDKCGTCRKAKQYLSKRKLDFDEVDITAQPPSRRLLSQLLQSGQYKLADLFNKSGQQYRELNMKERLKSLSEAEAIALLSDNGRLVKRPIVTDGERHSVGFDERRFAALWHQFAAAAMTAPATRNGAPPRARRASGAGGRRGPAAA